MGFFELRLPARAVSYLYLVSCIVFVTPTLPKVKLSIELNKWYTEAELAKEIEGASTGDASCRFIRKTRSSGFEGSSTMKWISDNTTYDVPYCPVADGEDCYPRLNEPAPNEEKYWALELGYKLSKKPQPAVPVPVQVPASVSAPAPVPVPDPLPDPVSIVGIIPRPRSGSDLNLNRVIGVIPLAKMSKVLQKMYIAYYEKRRGIDCKSGKCESNGTLDPNIWKCASGPRDPAVALDWDALEKEKQDLIPLLEEESSEYANEVLEEIGETTIRLPKYSKLAAGSIQPVRLFVLVLEAGLLAFIL